MTHTSLVADALRQDSRTEQAMQLLQEVIQEHRQSITGIRPPQSELVSDYEKLIASFSEQRGGNLFYPYLGSGIGNGALVELADGSVKYDMITGIGVHAFGHSDPDLLNAALRAALGDTIMQGNLQQNEESAELCRDFVELASQTGAPLKHCFLTTSGATANENALKLLFQSQHPASRLLAFSNCFAGRTLATAQLTDRAKNRSGLPTVLAVDYVPYFDHRHPDESLSRTLSRLNEHITRYPQAHAGMVMELIQGEGGYYAAPREYLVAVCQFLRENSIPIFFDEIQTFGRTTQPFAFQHFQLEAFADVVTVGKMTQVCATLFRDELVPQPGLISQTFTGATSSIFAARTILQRLQSGGFHGKDGRIMQVHQRFAGHFDRIHRAHPEWIQGPWGLGGMVAFTALDGSAARSKEVLDALFEAGVMAFAAGGEPTRIRMLPPFGCLEDQQIDEVCRIIEAVLKSLS